jgi:transcriptional regulator with XRE-family HTH domain
MARNTIRRLEPSDDQEPTQNVVSKDQDFARRLQYHMEQNGMTNRDLARAVWGEKQGPNGRREARGRDNISKYLRGTIPQPKSLRALAEALGVEVHDLSPEHTKASLDWEPQMYSMRAAPGHPDKAHLTVDMIVPSKLAAQILAMLTTIQEEDKVQ